MCWISVETQLPEDDTKVDIWVKGDLPETGRRFTDLWYSAGKFYFESLGWTVTHWRYPPAPPEGM